MSEDEAEIDDAICEEKLRLLWESDEMWDLRKKFLERHWKTIQRDRLLCLAQIFINVEFLGCKYHEKLMEEVADLSRGICDSYREKRKVIVEQTFVKETPSDTRTSAQTAIASKRKRPSLPASNFPHNAPPRYESRTTPAQPGRHGGPGPSRPNWNRDEARRHGKPY